MNRYLQYITRQYWFRVVLTVLVCTVTVRFGILQSYTWFGVCICLLILCILWQIRLYRTHVKQVLFMIDALENNDNSFHFPEEYGTPESRQINQALNRVGHILYNVKAETAQQEKYYELILDFVSTGLLVLNDNGAVYQKNKEALRLLGLNIFTHIRQLSKVDATLMEKMENCRPGDKLQVMFHNERGTVNLSIRVSEINVHKEHLRILHADENLISQVVINLLKNAVQAIGNQPGGRIAIQAHCNDAEEVLIEIKNNGPAIPPEIAEHIFIPFFTTKERGSGIGLSISRQIMRLSGGSLTLIPDDKETKFILKFK